jgi:hypothetical protein
MADFLTRAQDSWCWRLLIRAPGWLDAAALDMLRDKARKKAPGNTALDRVSLWSHDEGLCLQSLHRGPYADEGPLIARLHAEAAKQGLAEAVWKRERDPALVRGTAQVGCHASPMLKMLLAARLSGS